MLELIIRVLLALAVVGFVGYPLLKNAAGADEDLLSEEAEELYRRKESTYSAIKELEFDYRTGKLSSQDYRDLDAKYRAEAIEILEAIELYEGGEAAEATQAKAAADEGKSSPSRAETEEAVSAATAQPGSLTALVCAECGEQNPVGSKFCAVCGQAMVADMEAAAGGNGHAEVCEECGGPVGKGHKFCAGCGAEVRA